MKKFTLLFLMLMAFGVSASFAQTSNDSIIITKVFGGHKFEKSGINLTMNQVQGIVEVNQDALKQMRLANTDEIFSSAFAYSGGFCLGYALAEVIMGKADEATLILSGIGVGMAAIGIGLGSLADSHVVKAANIYNMHLGDKSNHEGANLSLGVVPNGVGLTLSF